MDIIIKNDEEQFSYRVSAIIVQDNKVLVQKNSKFNYVSLPGGKCELNETSYDAIIREIKEETGLTCSYIKTKAIIENFFYSKFNERKVHEINIISQLQFTDLKILNDKVIKNIEDKYKDVLWYEWIDIDTLDELEHYPVQLKEIINSDILKHYIRQD